MKFVVIFAKMPLRFALCIYEAAILTGIGITLLMNPAHIPVFGIIPKTGTKNFQPHEIPYFSSFL